MKVNTILNYTNPNDNVKILTLVPKRLNVNELSARLPTNRLKMRGGMWPYVPFDTTAQVKSSRYKKQNKQNKQTRP